MQLRNTMILVLVVWLLLGWVRSQEGATDTTHRPPRRAHLRRRILEKLAERGLPLEERKRMAEELLARLDHLASTTTTTPSPPQTRHHRHRHHHHTYTTESQLSPKVAMIAEQMVGEQTPDHNNLKYSQEFPGFETFTADEALQQQEEEEEEEQQQEEMVTRSLLHQYMVSEDMEDLMRYKREELVREGRNRSPKSSRRNERRQENRRRRERLKEIKKHRKRRDRKVKKMINDTIELYEEGGIKYIDCCPSVIRNVRKTVGKDWVSHRSMDIKPGHQVFAERLCLEGFEDKECIIPANALKPEVSTRCVQQYSYSQAFTRRYNSNDEWQVGTIQVGSGCSCQVSINHKKKKRKRKKR